MSMSVGLFVCLSAHITQKQHGQTLPIFVPVAYGPCSVLLLQRYIRHVMYFRSCWWPYFHTMEPMGQNQLQARH